MNPLPARIRHLFISPGHNFKGHHGKPAGRHPVDEVSEVECVAGTGLVGDRFYGHEEEFKGQVTFFSWEVFRDLCGDLGVRDKPPSVLRRNVIVEGPDLNEWVGTSFTLQGVEFFGTEECSPCYWMDEAFAPGAETALQGKGGLRARILRGGTLRVDTR